MGLEDTLTFTLVTILILATMIFAVLFYKMLSQATKEYEKAKNIVRGIVITLKKIQDKQNKRLEQIGFNVESTQAATDKQYIKLQRLEDKIKSLIRSVKIQENLQKQIAVINNKIKKISNVKRIEPVLDVEKQPSLNKLTETEKQVLVILVEEGPKTAPDVENKIGKTREHTARLMKMLWQKGFIERDTHRIPFIYRPIKGLKKLLDKKMSLTTSRN